MEALWHETPPFGTCITCGASSCPDGFVDLISEVTLYREGVVSGYADLVMCADCLEQASRMVGCSSRDQTTEMTDISVHLRHENEKLKDEVAAWSQRFHNLTDAVSRMEVRDVGSNSDNPDVGKLSPSGGGLPRGQADHKAAQDNGASGKRARSGTRSTDGQNPKHERI